MLIEDKNSNNSLKKNTHRSSNNQAKSKPDDHINYKQIFKFSSLPYFILAADGAIMSMNFAGEEMLKISQKNIKAFNFKDFVNPDSRYLIDNAISKALLTGRKEVVEVVLSFQDKTVPVRINARTISSSFECLFEIIDLTAQDTIQKLSGSELAYRTLVKEAGVAIFIANANGNYIEVNKYACDLLGYTEDELLKLNMKDVIYIEDIKETPIQMSQLLEGQNVHTKRRMVRKDGSIFPVEISGKILSDGRLQGVVHDISKQKQIELALKESESNYKHAESIAHLGSWQMNIVTGKSKWSDEFYRICGYEPQSFEPLMHHRYEVVHPDDREKSENAIRKAIEDRSSYKLEKRILRPNGEIRYIQSVGDIILDKNGNPSELKGIFLDITDLKNTELELKQSEEKYRSLLEFLPIGLIIKNKNGEVVFQNDKSKEILNNHKALDNNNYNDYTFIRKDESILPLEEFPGNMALREGIIMENAEMGIIMENRKIWLNATASPLPGNEQVIVAFIDITEKIQREKQLKRLSEKLQELNATKDKFFSIIAHDLKNPFNSILGFSELLVKNVENYSMEEIERFVGIIHDTSQKTYNLLENLLIWARTQTGRLEFNPDQYNLTDLIKENIEFISPMALKKQILINFNVNGNAMSFVDKNMMDTVLRNILTNAVKFSYPESEIDVKISEMDDDWVVSVKDYGVGIEPENLCKLFHIGSKYSVLGTHNEKGTGLGLLIAKEFVKKNKGKIWVNSEPDKGSEFLVSVPRSSM
jgi:PAS domain S-box-containing protein